MLIQQTVSSFFQLDKKGSWGRRNIISSLLLSTIYSIINVEDEEDKKYSVKWIFSINQLCQCYSERWVREKFWGTFE